jgi:hypothetical protein
MSVLGAPSLVQTIENHCGLSQGCKEGVSLFPSPLLPVSPSSNLPCVDKHCHAVGDLWQFLRCLLPNCLVNNIVKQVNMILCINCYTMWKKINMNHSFESQNTLAMILPADSCVLNFLDLQKTCCTNHRQLHMTGFRSHTSHWTYEEFLLVLLSLSLGICWYITVLHGESQGLTLPCTSSNAQKRGAWPLAWQWVQCCHQLSIKELYFSGAHIMKEK